MRPRKIPILKNTKKILNLEILDRYKRTVTSPDKNMFG